MPCKDLRVEAEDRLLARLDIGHRRQHAVFQHAVVVDGDRDEHHVARAERVEAGYHVAQQSEFRRPQFAIATEPALRKDRLRHARRRRHVDIAREDFSIESLAGVARDEIGAHRTDQIAQAPDLGPLADGVAQRRRGRGDVGDQHVVHVGTMVDDEDDRRGGIDGGQRRVVADADPDPVEHMGNRPCDPGADAEISIGTERRHDLAGVALHLFHRDFVRYAGLGRVFFRRPQHFRVEHQPIDQHLPLGQLKRLDAQLEFCVELLDGAVGAPTQRPAHAGNQDAIKRRRDRKDCDDDDEPQRQASLRPHRKSSIPPAQRRARPPTASRYGLRLHCDKRSEPQDRLVSPVGICSQPRY